MRKIVCFLLYLFLLLPNLCFSEETVLQPGSKGTAVKELQLRLKELKLYSSAADGDYGAKTQAAVQSAQLALNAAGYPCEENGIADASFQELLFDKSMEEVFLTYRLGSSGPGVKELQNRLIELNLLRGKADGEYGENTQKAVLTFQQRMKGLGVDLGEDGIATPHLVEILNSDLHVYGFSSPVSYDTDHPEELTIEQIYAPSCILIDAPTGKVLFEKSADQKMYPASTTKIMTLLLAVEAGDLDRTVTIPEAAKEIPKDSSVMSVVVGETMTMRNLLYGMMICSGNDAANAVAELTAGSVENFVNLMNDRASALGMTNTHFVNPHGYQDENHYTTARDMAALTRCGLTNPDFCAISTCLEITLPATNKHKARTLRCTHEIFDPDSKYYIPYAAGVKSGTTSSAGFCYVCAYQRDGQTMIAVVLGEDGKKYAWMDLQRLFSYGMTCYKN